MVCETFPLDQKAKQAFYNLKKKEIEKVLLHTIDETMPQVVETDAFNTASVATLILALDI